MLPGENERVSVQHSNAPFLLRLRATDTLCADALVATDEATAAQKATPRVGLAPASVASEAQDGVRHLML